MNQKRSMLNLFVCLSAVLLVVLATSVVVSAGDPAAEKTDATFLAANPELMFARRYVAAEAAERAAALANPMLYVRHYVVVSAVGTSEKAEATLLAANPELRFARRYIGAAVKKAEVPSLAANPELRFASRYIGAAVKEAEVASLAANPELRFASRYIGAAVKEAEVASLAANPELRFASRYVAAEAAERVAAFSACYEGHH